MAQGLVAEPRELVRSQLVAPPRHLRRRIVLEVRQEVVPVAADVRLAHLAQAVDDGAAPRPLARVVAEVDHPGDAAGPDVREHGLQRAEVAVDVGDDGDAVQVTVQVVGHAPMLPRPPARTMHLCTF